jgi:putative transposase
MSRKYKFRDQDKLYFVSFATVYWIDVFTRRLYNDIVVDSLKFCMVEKDLDLYAWCLMTSHIHLIMGTRGEPMENILRDMKKHTSKKLTEAIASNPTESRREWMLAMMERAGAENRQNRYRQFWQQHNKPIELNTVDRLRRCLNYVHQNPVEAGFVARAEDWVYSSAVNYYRGEQGLIDGLILEI